MRKRQYTPKEMKGLVIFASAVIIVYVAFFVFVFTSSPSDSSGNVLQPVRDVVPNKQTAEWQLQFVSGTEYFPNQEGQIIVEARYRDGSSAITGAGEFAEVSNFSLALYDDTDVDTDPDSIFAVKFDETLGSRVITAHGDKICSFYDPWESFKCGGFTPVYPPFEFIEVMLRDNTTINSGSYKLGVRTTIQHSYTQYGPPQGYIFISDLNQTGNYDVRGPVEGNQYHLDIYRATVYKREDGVSTQLGDGPNIGCTSSNCNAPAITPGTNISFYKINDVLYVEENDVVILNVTDPDDVYQINEQTTWGMAVLPAVTGSGATNGAVGFYDLYDVVNESAVTLVNPAPCYTSVWDPDKDIFIDDQQMEYQENSENAYYDFVVPNVEGVFEYQSRCEIDGNNQTVSKSFHVTRKRIRAEVVK